MLKEFHAFAMRGNVIDLAVGVIIGAAFGAIVSSLVDQIIMPPIGLLIGGIDFSDIKWVLKAAEGDAPEVAIGIGLFVNSVIKFVIIAFAIFLIVRTVNSVMAPPAASAEAPAAAPAEPSAEEKLLTEIRDLLARRG